MEMAADKQAMKLQMVVPGMGSNHCAGLVSTSLNRLEGVITVTTNIANHHVDVEYDAAKLTARELQQAVEKAGYDVDSLIELSAVQTIVITVPGMGSNHCSGIISESLNRLDGIENIVTNIATHQVTVTFDKSHTDSSVIRQAIEKAGYEVAALQAKEDAATSRNDSEERYLKKAWSNL